MSKLRIKNARLAFPQLFQAKPFAEDQPARFSAAFILPKNDKQVETIEETLKEVAREKWGKKGNEIYEKLSSKDGTCFRDGDEKDQDGFENSVFLSSGSKNRPLILDKDKSYLSEADGRPYAGCYVNATVNIWAQDNSYGKRINADLKGVQFVRDGEPFSGGPPANPEDFDDLSDTGDDEDVNDLL